MSDLDFVDPLALKDAIVATNGSIERDFVVVDVRDDDFNTSGHIKGCINVPSTSSVWSDEEELKKFTQSFCTGTNAPKEIIFHCAQSLKRGPACARLFSKSLSDINIGDQVPGQCDDNGTIVSIPVVRVLRGGFQDFDDQFASSEEASVLIEK